MRYDVNISVNILNWVLSNLNLEETNPAIVEILSSWIKEEKTPTYNQVLEISRATGVPLGYFFLKTPPKEDLSFVNYRTIKSIDLKNPSSALKTTMLDMELIQDWLHNALKADGYQKNSYVNSLKKSKNISDQATIIRNSLNLDIDWYKKIKTNEDSFKYIRNLISNIGVFVMTNGIVRNNTSKLLSINEFRAFALLDDYAPLIFINTNDSVNGRLFSLLHEFVHIGLGENSLYNDRCGCNFEVKATETICNAVAAEILVPQEKFIIAWKNLEENNDITSIIAKLSKSFKCGTTVIARKALENRFITLETYQSHAQYAVKNYKKNKSKGGDFYRSLNSKIDSNFLTYLISNVDKGKTLYTDAFRLTNTNRKTFSILKNQIEGGLL